MMNALRVLSGQLAAVLSATLFVLALPTHGFAFELNDELLGRVTGRVFDEFNAMTLPMAPVEVVDREEIVYTELDGRYSFDIVPGSYEVKVSFSGYEDQVIPVEVAAGQTVTLDVPMSMTRFTEEVVVTAQVDTPELFTSEAQLVERRKATVISDNLASEDMKKNADSTAASAMQRVTGLTVVDNQYVFVRGLGERYSNTQLNGATIPTTEPDKKVVPLDLFPSGLIQSVTVQKSYMPDKAADFTGGLVEIEPLNFPETTIFDFSITQGYNAETSFKDFNDYHGGDVDFLGFDDGTRDLPGVIPTDQRVTRGSPFTGLGFTEDELRTFGTAFPNIWNPGISSSAAPNQSYSLVYGGSSDRVGGIFSFSYNYKNQNQQEEQNIFKVSGDEVTLQNGYDFDISETKTTMGMVGNISFKLNGSNRLAFENFYTKNSTNETRFFEGFNSDIDTTIRNNRLYWIEESIYSTKLSGEHYLQGLGNSRLDWRTAFSFAVRDEPDLRETLYEFNPTTDTFVLADESQSGLRMFNNLDDNIYEVGADWSFYTTQWSGLPSMVKVGPYFQVRRRDFSSRRFRYKPINQGRLDLSQPPETLFSAENVGTFFELDEETRPTDTYDAEQFVTAAYAMIDLPLSERLRLVGGARVERSDQEVNTFDLFAIDPTTIISQLDDTDVLPGMNLILLLTEEMNLRFGFSRTVNRPEFRELAPFEFTDVVGGRAVVGNPDLKRAIISNFDLRWEWFPGSSEIIAASFFYKDFTDPIERTVQAIAQLRTSYTNAAGATNTGFELEARKNLGRYIFVSANYTFVDSEIDIGRAASEVQTSAVRTLAGQSENVFNTVVEFQAPSVGFSTRVLFNFFGDRIVDVGALGLPDIIEEGRGTLDLVATKRLGEAAQLRFSFDNMLDSEYRFTQGGELQRFFQLGPTFSVSFSYSLF